MIRLALVLGWLIGASVIGSGFVMFLCVFLAGVSAQLELPK